MPDDMRTVPIIVLFLSAGLSAEAQLNIVPKSDGLKKYTAANAQPYDSLMNVDERSIPSLPGQTLFMHGARNDGMGYYEAFFTANFLDGGERPIYKDERGKTPSEAVVGKYWEVLEAGVKNDRSCYLLLREKESGDKVYYHPFLYPLSMTCLGYYEKLKRFIGRTFFSLAKRVETEDGQSITPAEGAEYRCVDVGLKMNSYGAFLLLEGADGVRVEAFPVGGDDEVFQFVSAARIASLTERYGKKYGMQIAYEKVDGGMTEEMVIAAWGKPNRKSEMKREGRTLESWSYSDDRFPDDRHVEFIDGKVRDVRIYGRGGY